MAAIRKLALVRRHRRLKRHRSTFIFNQQGEACEATFVAQGIDEKSIKVAQAQEGWPLRWFKFVQGQAPW